MQVDCGTKIQYITVQYGNFNLLSIRCIQNVCMWVCVCMHAYDFILFYDIYQACAQNAVHSLHFSLCAKRIECKESKCTPSIL